MNKVVTDRDAHNALHNLVYLDNDIDDSNVAERIDLVLTTALKLALYSDIWTHDKRHNEGIELINTVTTLYESCKARKQESEKQK